jgi:hypothetical protein
MNLDTFMTFPAFYCVGVCLAIFRLRRDQACNRREYRATQNLAENTVKCGVRWPP